MTDPRSVVSPGVCLPPVSGEQFISVSSSIPELTVREMSALPQGTRGCVTELMALNLRIQCSVFPHSTAHILSLLHERIFLCVALEIVI